MRLRLHQDIKASDPQCASYTHPAEDIGLERHQGIGPLLPSVTHGLCKNNDALSNCPSIDGRYPT